MGVLFKHRKILPSFFEKHAKVYLYGAGKGGRACLWYLRSVGFEPDGFIVSKRYEKNCVDGLPVYIYSDIKHRLKNSGVIITVVPDENKKEIFVNLLEVEIGETIIWHQQ